MNKKESAIILKSYYDMYFSQTVCGIDKSDSIRDFSFMLKTLGMTKEKYEIENKIISDHKEIKGTAKVMFEAIFESFAKFGAYVHFDLEEIDTYYENLQYKMDEEGIKCHKARISYLTN